MKKISFEISSQKHSTLLIELLFVEATNERFGRLVREFGSEIPDGNDGMSGVPMATLLLFSKIHAVRMNFSNTRWLCIHRGTSNVRIFPPSARNWAVKNRANIAQLVPDYCSKMAPGREGFKPCCQTPLQQMWKPVPLYIGDLEQTFSWNYSERDGAKTGTIIRRGQISYVELVVPQQ